MTNEEVGTIAEIAATLVDVLRRGGKIVLCGNGGSAADAQHIAAEFVGRFSSNRRPLPALALSADSAVITGIGNDFGYEQVFARQVEVLVEEHDVLVILSTSGTSPNVLAAVKAAKQKGAVTLGFTGKGGSALQGLVDRCLSIPTTRTAQVQEGYLAVWHILCGLIEDELQVFGS